jgi:hypothetical protein
MPGMIPNKKTVQEIEQDYEALRNRHDKLVADWLKARFEPAPSLDQGAQFSCNYEVDKLFSD